MARRYKRPHCVAELPEGRICGHEMSVVGERHPYQVHYRQEPITVFRCGYCDAVQAISHDRLEYCADRA